MQHFYNLADLESADVSRLLAAAVRLKRDPISDDLQGKQIALLFLAPSLRTRSSFEVGIRQLGGAVSTLEPSMFYGLELEDDVRMDRDKAEHVREAIPVLSRYYAGLGVRVMAAGKSSEEDLNDVRCHAFLRHATVPMFNMESALYHPCQALADLLTIQELLGSHEKRRITISWAPHTRPLPTAVPNSLLLAFAQMGMDVTLAHPKGFGLPGHVVNRARQLAGAAGGAVKTSEDQKSAVDGAEIVYAKSWAALSLYESPEEEAKLRASNAGWMIDRSLMDRTADAHFMHCLPVRRNVVVSDEVLDSPQSVVIDQAENRLHAQKAVLQWLYGSPL